MSTAAAPVAPCRALVADSPAPSVTRTAAATVIRADHRVLLIGSGEVGLGATGGLP